MSQNKQISSASTPKRSLSFRNSFMASGSSSNPRSIHPMADPSSSTISTKLKRASMIVVSPASRHSVATPTNTTSLRDSVTTASTLTAQKFKIKASRRPSTAPGPSSGGSWEREAEEDSSSNLNSAVYTFGPRPSVRSGGSARPTSVVTITDPSRRVNSNTGIPFPTTPLPLPAFPSTVPPQSHHTGSSSSMAPRTKPTIATSRIHNNGHAYSYSSGSIQPGTNSLSRSVQHPYAMRHSEDSRYVGTMYDALGGLAGTSAGNPLLSPVIEVATPTESSHTKSPILPPLTPLLQSFNETSPPTPPFPPTPSDLPLRSAYTHQSTVPPSSFRCDSLQKSRSSTSRVPPGCVALGRSRTISASSSTSIAPIPISRSSSLHHTLATRTSSSILPFGKRPASGMDFNVPKPTLRAPRPLPSIPSSSSSRSSNELWRSVEDSASSRSFNLRTGHSNINRDSMVFGLGFGSGDTVQISKPMPILRPSSMFIDEPSDSDSEDILSLGESESGSSDEHFARPSSILLNSSIMEDDLHSNVDRKARRRQGVDFHSRADFVEMVKLLNEEVDRGDQEIEENAAITMSEVLEQEIRAVGLDSNPMTTVSSAPSVIYNDGGDEEDPDDFSWEAEEESGEVIELGVDRSLEVRGNKLEKIGDVHYEDVNILPAAMGVGNGRTNPPLGDSPLIKPHSLSPPRPEISIPSVNSITISQPSPLDALAMYDALGGRPDSFSSYELLSSNTESSSHQHDDLEENEPGFEPRSAFDSDTESEDESPKHKHSIKISNGWGSKTSNSKVNTFSQLKKALRGSISMPSVKVRSSTQLSPRPIPSSHTGGATAAASQDKDQIHKQSFSTPPSAVSTHSHSISISSPTTRLTNTTATNRYSPTSSPLTSPSKLRSLVHEEQLLRIDSRSIISSSQPSGSVVCLTNTIAAEGTSSVESPSKADVTSSPSYATTSSPLSPPPALPLPPTPSNTLQEDLPAADMRFSFLRKPNASGRDTIDIGGGCRITVVDPDESMAKLELSLAKLGSYSRRSTEKIMVLEEEENDEDDEKIVVGMEHRIESKVEIVVKSTEEHQGTQTTFAIAESMHDRLNSQVFSPSDWKQPIQSKDEIRPTSFALLPLFDFEKPSHPIKWNSAKETRLRRKRTSSLIDLRGLTIQQPPVVLSSSPSSGSTSSLESGGLRAEVSSNSSASTSALVTPHSNNTPLHSTTYVPSNKTIPFLSRSIRYTPSHTPSHSSAALVYQPHQFSHPLLHDDPDEYSESLVSPPAITSTSSFSLDSSLAGPSATSTPIKDPSKMRKLLGRVGMRTDRGVRRGLSFSVHT